MSEPLEALEALELRHERLLRAAKSRLLELGLCQTILDLAFALNEEREAYYRYKAEVRGLKLDVLEDDTSRPSVFSIYVTRRRTSGVRTTTFVKEDLLLACTYLRSSDGEPHEVAVFHDGPWVHKLLEHLKEMSEAQEAEARKARTERLRMAVNQLLPESEGGRTDEERRNDVTWVG